MNQQKLNNYLADFSPAMNNLSDDMQLTDPEAAVFFMHLRFNSAAGQKKMTAVQHIARTLEATEEEITQIFQTIATKAHEAGKGVYFPKPLPQNKKRGMLMKPEFNKTATVLEAGIKYKWRGNYYIKLTQQDIEVAQLIAANPRITYHQIALALWERSGKSAGARKPIASTSHYTLTENLFHCFGVTKKTRLPETFNSFLKSLDANNGSVVIMEESSPTPASTAPAHTPL